MIAREVLAVKEQLKLDHLDLTCLPAEFHFYPDRIAPAMDKAIDRRPRRRATSTSSSAMPIAAPAAMLDRVCEKHGVERMAGPHCFAFYQGMEAYEKIADDDMMSFYMTDFLCRQFDAFFMKPLGLDRHPELIKDYFGNYEKLVYLAQTDDPELDKVAEAAARLLGLAYERRATGYGDLPDGIARAAAPSPDLGPAHRVGRMRRTRESRRHYCPSAWTATRSSRVNPVGPTIEPFGARIRFRARIRARHGFAGTNTSPDRRRDRRRPAYLGHRQRHRRRVRPCQRHPRNA